MKLNPGERSVLAYFPSSTRAQAAAEDLKKNGLEEVQIDRVSRYGVTYDNNINNPIAGRAESGTGLTLFASNTDSFTNNDARVLMGADPSNSGYGDEDYGIGGGKAFLLTVVTSEDNIDKVTNIIKQYHGQV